VTMLLVFSVGLFYRPFLIGNVLDPIKAILVANRGNLHFCDFVLPFLWRTHGVVPSEPSIIKIGQPVFAERSPAAPIEIHRMGPKFGVKGTNLGLVILTPKSTYRSVRHGVWVIIHQNRSSGLCHRSMEENKKGLVLGNRILCIYTESTNMPLYILP